MSKIIIIFLFSILIQNVFSQTNPKEFAETVYEYIKDLFEGMSTNVNTSKCIKTISDKKDYFIENIEPIIANIYEPTKLPQLLLNHGLNILTTHGLAKNCKLLNFILFYNKLTRLNEINDLGILIYKNAEEIANIFDKTDEINSIVKKLGELARVVLNFIVK